MVGKENSELLTSWLKETRYVTSSPASFCVTLVSEFIWITVFIERGYLQQLYAVVCRRKLLLLAWLCARYCHSVSIPRFFYGFSLQPEYTASISFLYSPSHFVAGPRVKLVAEVDTCSPRSSKNSGLEMWPWQGWVHLSGDISFIAKEMLIQSKSSIC